MSWWYLAILVAANLSLLLPEASVLRVGGALLLVGFLPGLSWVGRWLPPAEPLLRWTVAAALSYVFTSLTILLLYYLPGPVQTWQLLVVLNLLAVLPLLSRRSVEKSEEQAGNSYAFNIRSLCPFALCLILAVAIWLRFTNLDYSEFQGDEALAMISTAEALEGHQYALFLRSKGPGEILLPMALWRLTGTISEAAARSPFTIGSLFAIVTIYLIGEQVGGRRVSWLAAGFLALNGFMVAFGRIVQYQALVVWMSGLAFLLTLHWRTTGQLRYLTLAGLFLGTGLLAHYDAILVLPAIGWLLIANQTADARQSIAETGSKPVVSGWRSAVGGRIVALFKPILLLLAALLVVALPFYLPFILDPQANRTGDYVGQRIGTELRNNLPDFFHFNTFYSSSYYTFLTGLLIVGLLGWIIWQRNRKYRWAAVVVVAGVLAVSLRSDLLLVGSFDLSFLPFALLFLGAFLTFPASQDQPEFGNYGQALIVWLAVPFLGYNFIVALGLTHIYTIVPAWSLLAALGWYFFLDSCREKVNRAEISLRCCALPTWLANGLLVGLLLLSTLFLWNAFIRHDVEYLQDYPDANLSLFWTPYDQAPKTGFFGFAHRAGWKTIGQKIAAGELLGDYSSNEEPDVTTWYTRGAARACDPYPEFYFLADDLVDPVEVSEEIVADKYGKIGSVRLPNQKAMQILQQKPTTLTFNELDDTVSSQDFDRTATPAAFARSARGTTPIETNFSNLVRLIGFDVDTRRAYPGGRVPVTLYWQPLTQILVGYHVFAHLESDTGPVAQADGVPVCWSYPTDLWRPDQIIADQHAIPIPTDTPPGTYPLQVGLYLPDTFERLDILDAAGNPAGVSITLTDVEIKK